MCQHLRNCSFANTSIYLVYLLFNCFILLHSTDVEFSSWAQLQNAIDAMRQLKRSIQKDKYLTAPPISSDLFVSIFKI